MSTNKPYTQLPAVWDQMGQDRHSIKMVSYTLEIMKRHKIRATTGLDLCCGTGTAINLFLDHGFIMAGLDGSPEMIAFAAKKLRGRGVRLYQKMLPKFRLIPDDNSRGTVRFDFVTSFYDSLNYMLTPEDLGQTFKSVANHLNDGGWFIFDMNTKEALTNIWGGHVYADSRDDLAWIWKNDFDPRTARATCLTTTFVREGSSWRRFDENHTEAAYSNTRIKHLLKEAGFRVKEFYECYRFTRPNRDTLRICAVAQRK